MYPNQSEVDIQSDRRPDGIGLAALALTMLPTCSQSPSRLVTSQANPSAASSAAVHVLSALQEIAAEAQVAPGKVLPLKRTHVAMPSSAGELDERLAALIGLQLLTEA